MAKPKKTANLFYRDGNPWMDWTHREPETGIAIRRYRESLNLVAGEIITEKEHAIAVMEKTKTLIREGRFRGTFAKSEKSEAEKKLITVSEVVKQYSELHLSTLSGTTDFRSILTRFEVFYGTRPIQSITTIDVDRYIEGLKKPEKLHARHKTERERAPDTIVTHFIRLRAFFNKALEWQFITATPFRSAVKVLIKKPKGQKRRPCPLTLEQQMQLVDAIAKDHPPALGWLIVALDTGLRHGEQFGLWNRRDGLAFDKTSGIRVRDMNFFTGKLTVRPEVAKNGKQRMVKVATKRALAALKEACQPGGVARHPDELIFVDIDGNPIKYSAPIWRLKKAAKACNITVKVFWHGLRHVFGKNSLKAGIAAPFIQWQYGHATLEQTVVYLDIDDDGTAEAMMPLAALVEPGDTSTTQEGEAVGKSA